MAEASSNTPTADRSTFHTTDGDQITGLLREQYVDNRIHFHAPEARPRFAFATVATPELASDALRSSIDYGGTCDPFDYYLFYTCRSGHMRVDSRAAEQRLLPGDPTFFPPGHALDFDFHDVGLQTLKLAPGRLEQVAAVLTGTPAAQIRFDGVQPHNNAARDHWEHTFRFIRGTLTSPDAPLSPLLTGQLVHLLVATALTTFSNTAITNAQHSRTGNVSPAAVRRAVAYIETHAHQALTLGDIATAAGTTGRALQYGFRKHHDTTPLAYLRHHRLQRAHLELQAADPTHGDTVAAIAARWGFVSAASFSTTYRQSYGQPPSRTLRT